MDVFLFCSRNVPLCDNWEDAIIVTIEFYRLSFLTPEVISVVFQKRRKFESSSFRKNTKTVIVNIVINFELEQSP